MAGEKRSKEEDELRDKGFNQEIYEEDWRATKVWLDFSLVVHTYGHPLAEHPDLGIPSMHHGTAQASRTPVASPSIEPPFTASSP